MSRVPVAAQTTGPAGHTRQRGNSARNENHLFVVSEKIIRKVQVSFAASHVNLWTSAATDRSLQWKPTVANGG